MKRITKYFFEGLVVILPLVATIYFTYLIFIKIDSLFQFKIPGIGFLITISSIIIIGVIASNFLTHKIFDFIDYLFGKLPLIKIIYNSFRDLIEAFVGEKRRFKVPVLVNLNDGKDVGAFGFLTEEDLSDFGLNDKVAVYLPHSYNFTGNLIVVNRDQVTRLNAGAKEVMTFIVSGGLTQANKNE